MEYRAKLFSLINQNGIQIELQNELETLVTKHSKITKELNSLDENSSIVIAQNLPLMQ